MAFSIQNGGSRGRHRFHGQAALSEMNILPLVDVVLVLLIIFMLTAHVMEFGLEIDVPKVKPTSNTVEELPVVGITRSAAMTLNDQKINIHQLGAEIKRRFPKATTVFV